MSIKFNFELDKFQDAAFLDCLRDEITRMREMALENPTQANWFNNRANYIEDLKDIILKGRNWDT